MQLVTWSCFSSTFTHCFFSYCDNPSFNVCLQASLSVAATYQESVFIPNACRSHLHMSMKRSWGRPFGLFPVASSPYKRSFKIQPSVLHVLAIACAFALRECISLVSQPLPAQLYLPPCPAMWFPEYVWGSTCETHSTFSLGVHALSKTHFLKAECWLHRLYIHWLWYDLKACCWTILVLWAWRVSWQPFQFAYSVHCWWTGCLWW